MEMAQFITYGVINGTLYGLVALGLSLVFGIMGYLNVSHGHLVIVGAYGTFWLFKLLDIDPFLSTPLVMIALFIIGVILYMTIYSPLLKFPMGLRLQNSLLISFGLMMIIENVMILLWTADDRSVTPFYSGQVIEIGELRIPYIGLATLVLAIVVVLALNFFMTRTYLGKSIRATSQDWEAAKLMGVNISRTYIVSFALGIALAGVAGAVISMKAISPFIGADWTNYGLVLVILAGVGNINAILPAGLLLGVVEAVSVYFVGAPYAGVVGLVVFLLVLLFKPQGLFKGM